MEEVIDQRVALALSKHSTSQQAPAASGAHDEMSPSSKRKSSVTSTEAAPAATDAGTPVVEERRPHYPVDDITVRSTCDLLTKVRNKMLVVAYGMAEVPTPGETFMEYPLTSTTADYTKVFVDRVVDSWDDFELEPEGPDGEETLGEAVHRCILWPKDHLRITQQPMEASSPARSAMPGGQDSPARRERSSSPEHAAGDRDPSVSPTPSPAKSKGSKRGPPPPPPHPKKQKKVKTSEKKSYEKTSEELDESVAKSVHDHFHGPKPPPEKKLTGLNLSISW